MMKKKILAAAMAAAMLAGLLPAGSAFAEEGTKEVSIGVSYDASSLDAAMASDDGSYVPIKLCTESLLRLVNGEAVPGIAESYEVSDDSMEWTFHLRESTFEDGTPVTAQDFVYTIQRLANPENALDQAADTYFIEGAEAYNSGEGSVEDIGVEAVDDYTLKITCCQPAYPITFTSHSLAPVSQATVEANGIGYGAEAGSVLFNGPFTVSEWVHDGEITLTKNENYWDADSINVDVIHMITGAAGDTAVDMLLTDSLDVATFSTAAPKDAVMENEGFVCLDTYSGAQFIHLNSHGKTEETGKWLGNENFRKALSAALDREALVAAVYTADQPSSKYVPDTEMGVEKAFNEEYEYAGWETTQNVEAAQEYLAAAMEELGASDASEIPTFTMLAYDSEGNVTALNAVADMWSQVLGISCELDMQPIGEMVTKAVNGDWDFWKGSMTLTLDSLDGLIAHSKFGDVDPLIYDDAEYDALCETAIYATSWADRKAAMAECADYFAEHMLDLQVTWEASYTVYSDKVTGIVQNGMLVDYTYIDIAE